MVIVGATSVGLGVAVVANGEPDGGGDQVARTRDIQVTQFGCSITPITTGSGAEGNRIDADCTARGVIAKHCGIPDDLLDIEPEKIDVPNGRFNVLFRTVVGEAALIFDFRPDSDGTVVLVCPNASGGPIAFTAEEWDAFSASTSGSHSTAAEATSSPATVTTVLRECVVIEEVEDAARCLFAAWSKRLRSAALTVASSSAVDALFERLPIVADFFGCGFVASQREGHACKFSSPDLEVEMIWTPGSTKIDAVEFVVPYEPPPVDENSECPYGPSMCSHG